MSDDSLRPRKGRGAVTNPDNRFDARQREAVDDGWGVLDEEAPPLRTVVTQDATRSIISRNRSPDVGFDRSINPYRGCEHGCVYCFARPTHAYLGFSPGLDFESRLIAKPEAPRLLREALARRDYRCEPMALGTNTDPYQPIEREWRITRGILEVLAEHKHPVAIVTKSALVERDLDILAPMAAQGLAAVYLSITTLDRTLARHLEPRAAAPQRRLETVRRLAEAGVPVGVMVAPLIPVLTDPEMESILEAAAAAGARRAGYVLLRLPLEVEGLFRDWLQAHAPLKAQHVMNRVQETRGGKAYDARFGARMRGEGVYAALLAQRFGLALRRLGLDRAQEALDTAQFSPPTAEPQLNLF